MSIVYYDEAITNKFRKWLPTLQNQILKPSETTRLFQMRADQLNDSAPTLPLIAISRDPSVRVQVVGRNPMTFSGTPLSSNEKVTIQLDAIPINLTYQVDIYTKKSLEADELVRGIMFNAINHPKMIVEIPYNGTNLQHKCNLLLQEEIVDNSDIPERLFSDQFTRWTLRFDVMDAFIWSVPVKENYKIGKIELAISEPDNEIISTEYVDEELFNK